MTSHIAEYTQADRDAAGRNLATRERLLNSYQEKIGAAEAKIRERERAGKDASGTRSRLAQFQGFYERERTDYENYRASLGDLFNEARRPQNYNTGGAGPSATRTASAYYAGRFETRQTPTGREYVVREQGFADRQRVEADRYAMQQARERPGIYELSGGRRVVSTLGDGGFISQRGERVTVRSPIASGMDGRPVYAAQEAPRTFTGIDLFDPQNQAAIRSSDAKTAGALFSQATPAAGPTFTPYTPSQVLLPGDARSRIGESNYYRRQTALAPAVSWFGGQVSNAGGFLQYSGDKLQQRFPESRSPGNIAGQFTAYAGRFTTGLGKKSRDTPDDLAGEAVISAYGGYQAGKALGVGIGGISTRYGAQAAKTTETAMNVVGIGGTAVYVATTPAEKLGAQSVNLASGGAGFGVGFTTRRNPLVSLVQNKQSYVTDDVTFKPGAIGMSGSTKGTATATFRGLSDDFVMQQTVPTEGGFLLSGGGAVRGNALVNVESMNSAVLRGKPYYSTSDFAGTLNVRTGRLFLQNEQRTIAYISQGGRGTGVGDVKTTPGSFAVFEKNAFGQYGVTRAGTTRGAGQTTPFTQVRVQPGTVRAGDARITQALFSPDDSPAGLLQVPADRQFFSVTPGSARPSNRALNIQSVRTVNEMPAGGFNYRVSRAAFNDAKVAGVYSDPPITLPVTSRVANTARAAASSRRGQFAVTEQSMVFRPPRTTTSPLRGVERQPILAGLPAGRYAIGQPRSFGFIAAPLFGSTSASSGFSVGRDTPRLSGIINERAPAITLIPGVDARILPSSRVTPTLDTSRLPRYELTPRITPGSPGPSPFVPVPPVTPPMRPPPPMLAGLPNFGVSSSGGDSRGRRNLYGYAPSLGAIAFNIRGDTSQRQFTGFELRPLSPEPRRKRRKR